MIKKRGITITMLMIIVIILTILSTTVVISVSNSINNANLSVWTQEIMFVQDIMSENVDEQESNLLSAVEFDISEISSEILQEQFKDEQVVGEKIVLYEINLAKIGMNSVRYGVHNSENDIYAYSRNTGKVYYLKGVLGDNTKVYYTLTNKLRNKYNEQSEATGELSMIVFEASSVKYTNQPITVKVKVPITYTSIQVTTSNTNVIVGGVVEEQGKYIYNVNTTNYAGNYEIYVSYNDGTGEKSTRYAVVIYDEKGPDIGAIKYENIVYRHSKLHTSDYIRNVNVTDKAGIKTLKYAAGSIDLAEAKEYFKENGIYVTGKTINLLDSISEYTIYAEDEVGNFTILNFDTKYIMPDSWKDSVAYIEDGAPIPKGFVASPYDGEGKVHQGLVIYALKTDEIENEQINIKEKDGNYQYSLEHRNQFVWVPVDNKRFDDLFIRNRFRWGYTLSPTVGENYWELPLENNMPIASAENLTNYISQITLDEGRAMYNSVKKYGGFYISRYEVGADDYDDTTYYGRGNLSLTMGKYPYNAVSWGTSMANEELVGGAVTVARSFYPSTETTYGVVSTLTYGVQWDRTLKWWEELNSDENFSLILSKDYGIYKDTLISLADLNENAQYSVYESSQYTQWKDAVDKTANGGWIYTTGAYKKAKVYNIYDMAGNMYEWVMEGYNTDKRIVRGGYISVTGETRPVSDRYTIVPDYERNYCFSFRPSLYIK